MYVCVCVCVYVYWVGACSVMMFVVETDMVIPEFKFWTWLYAFHIALMSFGKLGT